MSENRCEELCRHWVHSHEEDTGTEKVFRPATYDLPPSRGRFSFELKEDGSLLRYGLGPTDRTETSRGTWRLEGDRLEFCPGTKDAPEQVFEIVSSSPDRLVVRK